MKSILTIIAILISANSFAGNVYKCAEKSQTALAKNRLQYSVIIQELKKITDPKIVGKNDSATSVNVSILSRNPKVGGSFTLDRPSFKAVATSYDVMFSIDSKKENGFELSMYMDELDQTSVKIPGVKERVHMNCDFQE